VGSIPKRTLCETRSLRLVALRHSLCIELSGVPGRVRFTVYKSVEAYLTAVNTGNGESKERLYGQFAVAARHADFLFGPEVGLFIDAFLALGLERESHLEGDDRWCDVTLELTRRLTEDVESIFRPYLQLHQQQSWLARFIARLNRWVDSDQPAAMASRYDK
jgi:hypothetical protein